MQQSAQEAPTMKDAEQIARAICKAHYGLGETALCRKMLDDNWRHWVKPAQAAMRAIREIDAQAAMRATREIDAEAAAVEQSGPFARYGDEFADWLTQRAGGE